MSSVYGERLPKPKIKERATLDFSSFEPRLRISALCVRGAIGIQRGRRAARRRLGEGGVRGHPVTEL